MTLHHQVNPKCNHTAPCRNIRILCDLTYMCYLKQNKAKQSMNKQTEFMDIENRLLVTRGGEEKWEVVWEVGEMGEGIKEWKPTVTK